MTLPFSPQQGSLLPPMQPPAGTPPGMPPGLPPGPPALGGAAPDAMSLLRQQLSSLNQARPWSQGEGIGNILQSIGAGFQGQQPAWIGQEQELAQRKQRDLQLGMSLQQIQQSGQHMDAQNRLLQQQAQDYGWKTMERVSKFYPFVPEEQRGDFLNEWRSVIKDQFTTGLKGDQAGTALAQNDAFIDHMITAGEAKGKAFGSSYSFLSPQHRTIVAQTAMDDPKKAAELANTLAGQAVLPILSSVGDRMNAVRQQNPKLANQSVLLDDWW